MAAIPVGNVVRYYMTVPKSIQRKVKPLIVTILTSGDYATNQAAAWKAINIMENELGGISMWNLCGDDYG